MSNKTISSDVLGIGIMDVLGHITSYTLVRHLAVFVITISPQIQMFYDKTCKGNLQLSLYRKSIVIYFSTIKITVKS